MLTESREDDGRWKRDGDINLGGGWINPRGGVRVGVRDQGQCGSHFWPPGFWRKWSLNYTSYRDEIFRRKPV